MRVTNKMLSDNFLRDMRTNLSNLSNIQNQMSSGKEISKASDDPAKASKIMRINSDIAANTQYNTNIKDTSNWLDLTDTALSNISDSIGKIEGLLQSSTGTYTSDELTAVKDVINQEVASISQTLNGSFDGKYLFGGTNATTKPVGTKVVGGNTELVTNIKPRAITKLVTSGTTTTPTTTLTYAGKPVALGSSFNMTINGVSMQVTTSAVITSVNTPTTMKEAAATLQGSIQTSIKTANGAKGVGDTGYIDPSTVLVAANADGGFDITPSDTMTFSDIGNNTITKDLGLSQGPNKLLVEISQGVTMDYNVTANQVINYGTGDNNLMKLLSNITSHLDSTSATDKSKLTNEDLTGIQSAMTNILSLRSEVGAKQNSMTSAASRNDDQNDSMTEILSTTQNIDITQKAMEYATMQNVYTASLQTSAKVIQPTLLDYL